MHSTQPIVCQRSSTSSSQAIPTQVPASTTGEVSGRSASQPTTSAPVTIRTSRMSRAMPVNDSTLWKASSRGPSWMTAIGQFPKAMSTSDPIMKIESAGMMIRVRIRLILGFAFAAAVRARWPAVRRSSAE